MTSFEEFKKEIEAIKNYYKKQDKTGDDCFIYFLNVSHVLMSEATKTLRIGKI